jgi:thioredoxin-related protein
MTAIRFATLVLLLVGRLTAEEPPWRTSLDEALAGSEGKPLVLLFSLEGCVWCHRLIEESSANAETRQALGQVVGVVVRAEDQPSLVQRLGITSFPTLVLVNRKRELVRTINGYVPPEQLATTIRVLVLHGDTDGQGKVDLGRGIDVDALLAAADPVPGLIAALGIGEPAQRVRIREALAQRPAARDALWKALESPALGVRVDASAALAQQVGAPVHYDPFATADERSTAAAQWRSAATPGGDVVVP